jgi:hypothetical protein
LESFEEDIFETFHQSFYPTYYPQRTAKTHPDSTRLKRRSLLFPISLLCFCIPIRLNGGAGR